MLTGQQFVFLRFGFLYLGFGLTVVVASPLGCELRQVYN